MTTYEIALKRAGEIAPNDVVDLTDVHTYIEENDTSKLPVEGRTPRRFSARSIGGPRWRLVYDVNNGDGDEDDARLLDRLDRDQFVMLRVANHSPNAEPLSAHYRYVVVDNYQLVPVQLSILRGTPTSH